MDSQAVDVSSEQVEAVWREAFGLAASLRRARRVRLLLFLILLLLVGGVGLVAYAKANEFVSDKNLDHMAGLVRGRLEANQARYFKELQMLGERLKSPLEKAFAEQAAKDSPAFLKAVQKERQPFLDDLEKEFTKRINQRHAVLQPRYLKLLKEEFPSFKKEMLEAMAENFTPAFEKLIDKYYVKELHDEVLLLYATWDNFPPAADPLRSEPPIEDQLLPALWDLLAYRLTHPQEHPFQD